VHGRRAGVSSVAVLQQEHPGAREHEPSSTARTTVVWRCACLRNGSRIVGGVAHAAGLTARGSW